MKNNKLKLLLMIAVMLISADAFSAEDEAARAAHVRAEIDLNAYIEAAAAHDAGGAPRDFGVLFRADADAVIEAARVSGVDAAGFSDLADAANAANPDGDAAGAAARAAHVRAAIELHTFVTDAAAHDAGGRDFAALFGADARDIAAARAAGLTAEQFAVMADAADKAVHVRAVIERYSE